MASVLSTVLAQSLMLCGYALMCLITLQLTRTNGVAFELFCLFLNVFVRFVGCMVHVIGGVLKMCQQPKKAPSSSTLSDAFSLDLIAVWSGQNEFGRHLSSGGVEEMICSFVTPSLLFMPYRFAMKFDLIDDDAARFRLEAIGLVVALLVVAGAFFLLRALGSPKPDQPPEEPIRWWWIVEVFVALVCLVVAYFVALYPTSDMQLLFGCGFFAVGVITFEQSHLAMHFARFVFMATLVLVEFSFMPIAITS